jgi:uncharacterized protein (DUF305 family)
MPMRPRFFSGLLAGAVLLASTAAGAHDGHVHGAAAAVAPVFVASTAKPFAALMVDAMAVMDDGMRRAPMNGQPEHEFVTMMIPHHQGAVDMAKALLLTTTDPALRNMAQGIVAEQQIEIQLMQQWLKDHPAAATPMKGTP